MGGTLYAQTAAEYRALCYQAYHLAEFRLNEFLESEIENPAVILDLDETVLDNSPYTAWQITTGQPYSPETWADWVNEARAEAIPGALDFLHWADGKGVALFYVSNRDQTGLEATLENLQNLGVPQADSTRVLLKTDSSDKTARRERVMATGVQVVLYIGDNLGDYAAVWDKPATNPERLELLEKRKDEIGVQYIVLPNPFYGTWEGAVYGYNWDLQPHQRDSLRRRFLKPWEPASAL
jgi:5'-nucleotidase (lipoprotein e(P4) family)